MFSITLGGAAYLRMHYYQRLAESESRFRMMADSAPVMIWMNDAGKEGAWFNKQWLEFTGRTLEEERSCGWTTGIHADDRESYLQSFGFAWEGPRGFEVEYRLRRHDGVYRWILDRGVPIYAAGGVFSGFIGSCVDITERKAAEEQRERVLEEERRIRARAEEAGRLKDEFLATLSHELRTPLNAIHGWVQLLLRRFREPEHLRDGLEIVERNVRAQTQIVDDLLDMNRIISGKLKLDKRVLDVSTVVRNAIDTVRPTVTAKGIVVEAIFAADNGNVSGDQGRLQQVFWNLLANAVKFTPSEGKITVAVRSRGTKVEISVSDNGEGIAAEFLPQVFDRFRQADASTTRRYSGLGLGLAISKQLVELHGGEIEAHSEGLGKGAAFIVTLPLVLEGDERPEGDRKDSIAGASCDADEVDLHGVRLLVVDDEPDSRELLRAILTDAGAIVATSSSVAEALKRFEREPLDGIISDIAMPGADGHDLIRTLRQRSKRGSLAAIAVTAFARSEDRAAAFEAGFDRHLAKPVDRLELLQAVAELLLEGGAGRAV
jgi:PAS domain S-box-containing protein